MDFQKKNMRQIPRILNELFNPMLKFFHFRFNRNNRKNTIKHPHFGHFCIETNNGYKLFDLQKKAAIKLFTGKASYENFHRELNLMRLIGNFPFAPTVRKWSMEGQWYQEECLEGYRPDDSSKERIVQTILKFVVPLVGNIITSSSPQPIHPLDYATQQKRHFFGKESSFSQKDLNSTKVLMVREFVERIIHLLEKINTDTIFLTNTHGDLSFGHIRITKNGVRAIDWEAWKYRSALYDFHDIFFSRAWEEPPWSGLKNNMTDTIAHLQRNIARQKKVGSKNLTSSFLALDTYRLIFYIEKVDKWANRKNLTDSFFDKGIIPQIRYYTAFENIRINSSA